MMEGIHPMEQVRFGETQHFEFQPQVADAHPDPETSCTANYGDMAGIHQIEQVRFGETQHFELQPQVADAHPDPETSCTLNYGDLAGIHQIEQVRFGETQHFELQPQVADAHPGPETSCTPNYGDMKQDLQHIYNNYNALQEMVNIEGPVVLNPEVLMCGTSLYPEPQLTFSSDGFKIEYLAPASSQDGDLRTLFWEVSDIISIDCKWIQMVQSAWITLHVRSSAETVNSGPLKVEFCLADPQWEWKQQKIWQLDSRYQEVWKSIQSDDSASQDCSTELSLCFSKQYFHGFGEFEDFTYPKGDREAVEISIRDVELLLPEIFVNDTIIDFYIKYLSTRIEPTERCRYHFFNSFFFRKLADLDKDQEKAPKGREAFLCVRKWTRKIDIFAKDFLFIPVNFSLHWSLLVICYPGEVNTFNKDGDARIAGKLPCIMHMNSIKGTHDGLKDIIQSYLWEEWKERHPESASDSSDKFLNLRFLSLELPQQDNLFDCGLFLLHYVERFLMDAPSFFNPMKIDVFSSFLGDDWFVPAEASQKRSLIRKLIYQLVTEPSKTFPKLVCGDEEHDGRHHRSGKAIEELSREYLGPGCFAAESDPVCRILGAHQQSILICLNDSEKGLSVPGCILDTVGVEQEMQVCPPDNDIVVCSPSRDAQSEPFFAYSEMATINARRPLLGSTSEDKSILVSDDMFLLKGVQCTEDDIIKGSTKEETSTKSDKINDSTHYASSDSRDGYTDNATAGESTQGTDADDHEFVEFPCEGGTDAEMPPHVDGTCSAEDEDNSISDSVCKAKKMQVSEVFQSTWEDGIIESSKKEETSITSDKINNSTQYASSDLRNGNTDNAISGKRTLGTDPDGHELAGFPSEGGTDAEMPPHVDGACSAEDNNNSISDSVCKAKTMQVSEDHRSISEDALTEGSTKEETDTSADKMNGSEQYASYESEDRKTNHAGCGSEQHDVSSEAKNEKCPVGSKRPFPDRSICEAKKMQLSEDFRSTSEDDLVEGSTKEESDTSADKMDGREQYASYESEDGNTNRAGSDSEQHDISSEANNEKCPVGSKTPSPDSIICEATKMQVSEDFRSTSEDVLVEGSTKEETDTSADKLNGREKYASYELEDENINRAGSDSEKHDVSSEAKNEICCVGAKRPFPDGSICEAKKMQVSDFRSTSEDDIIEGSTKEEIDTAAVKMNGSEQYASYELEDGNTNRPGSGSEHHGVPSEAKEEKCCVGAKRPFTDGNICEAKKMQVSEDFQSTPEDDIIEGSRKEETDTAADKMNGCEQYASYELEDGNTYRAGSGIEHHDVPSETKNEKCCVGAKRPFPDSSICEAEGEVAFNDKFWQEYSERREARFGRWYKRRILCKRRIVWKRRKVISWTPTSSWEYSDWY